MVAAFLGEGGEPKMELKMVMELPSKVISLVWATVMYLNTALTLGNG